MAQKIQSVKGMNDLLPVGQKDFKLTAVFWQAFEDTVNRWTRAYGYQQIRTPIVEQTGLFVRSIGEETDVVGKEMYTFSDSNDSLSLSLRPEGTVLLSACGGRTQPSVQQPAKAVVYGTDVPPRASAKRTLPPISSGRYRGFGF